jgi:hypothetical protein
MNPFCAKNLKTNCNVTPYGEHDTERVNVFKKQWHNASYVCWPRETWNVFTSLRLILITIDLVCRMPAWECNIQCHRHLWAFKYILPSPQLHAVCPDCGISIMWFLHQHLTFSADRLHGCSINMLYICTCWRLIFGTKHKCERDMLTGVRHTSWGLGVCIMHYYYKP